MRYSDSGGRKNTHTTQIIADIARVSPDYVRKVTKGERVNEDILSAYMAYEEGHNELLTAVKALIPFPTSNRAGK